MDDKKKNNNREPFKPEHTPEPPQEMDPSVKPQRNSAEGSSREQSDEKKNSPDRDKKDKPEKKKLLGESEIEIDDETTI